MDDIDCNGQINITGSFDNWSGWGANPNNNHTIELNGGSYEYQVAAEMEKVFYEMGAERLGYPSIVAGGHNACILHYSTNRDLLDKGSLLLIDAAAEKISSFVEKAKQENLS